MGQLEQNQVVIREYITTMRTHMVQLMEITQAISRGQEELRHDTLRSAAVNPLVQPPMNPPSRQSIDTNPPSKGDLLNQNIWTTLDIPVNGTKHQYEIDNHQHAFFIPKVDPVLDTFGLPIFEVEKKFCFLEERMKGHNTFSLDAADICLVPGIKIPVKFKVPDFVMYKGISCPRTHIRSYCRKWLPIQMRKSC